jgi:hypothetical protein
MNRDFDASFKKSIFQLFGKNTLASYDSQRIGLNVSGGFDYLNPNINRRIEQHQSSFDLLRLSQSKFRTT